MDICKLVNKSRSETKWFITRLAYLVDWQINLKIETSEVHTVSCYL